MLNSGSQNKMNPTGVAQKIKYNTSVLKQIALFLPNVDSTDVLHQELSNAFNLALETNKLFEDWPKTLSVPKGQYDIDNNSVQNLQKKLYKDYHGALRQLDSVVMNTSKTLQQHSNQEKYSLDPLCRKSSKIGKQNESKPSQSIRPAMSTKYSLPLERASTIPLLVTDDAGFNYELHDTDTSLSVASGHIFQIPSVSQINPSQEVSSTHDYYALPDNPSLSREYAVDNMLCIQKDIQEIRTLYDQVAYQMNHQENDFDILETQVANAKNAAECISSQLKATQRLRNFSYQAYIIILCLFFLVLTLWFFH